MDAEHMDRERDADPELVRVIRAASGSMPDAARRAAIADGAWEQARALRERRRPSLRLTRPLGVAVAASLLIAVGLFSLVGRPESALAVEGDPVQVWKGGDWRSGSRVETDCWVFTPEGSRQVLLADGSTLEPLPGSMFMVRRRPSAGGLPFHVEVRTGSVNYSGDPLALSVSGVDVTPAHSDATMRLALSSSDDAQARPTSPDTLRFSIGAMPRVTVQLGSVIVRTRASGESMRLGEDEAATLFDAGPGAGGRRLTLLRSWSSSVVRDVVLGRLVADATPTQHGGMLVLLAGHRPEAIEIDATERVTAVRELNQAMTLCEGLVSSFGLRIDTQARGPLLWSIPREDALSVTLSIETSVQRTPFAEREYVLEQGGHASSLYVRRDGTCQLDRDGVVTEFALVDEFTSAEPDLARSMGLDRMR